MISHSERPARATRQVNTAVVFLHSHAGDEREVLPFLRDLDPEGRHVGLMPLGPLRSTPEGRHWYEIEVKAAPEASTFLPTLGALSAWLDETLAEHAIDARRAALAGFSQGAAMAYALGLARGRPSPAAILAFSGYLPRVERFELDLESRAGLRVAIAHGRRDAAVGVDVAREARDRLTAAGLDVRYHEDGSGHMITRRGFAQARAVLDEALA